MLCLGIQKKKMFSTYWPSCKIYQKPRYVVRSLSSIWWDIVVNWREVSDLFWQKTVENGYVLWVFQEIIGRGISFRSAWFVFSQLKYNLNEGHRRKMARIARTERSRRSCGHSFPIGGRLFNGMLFESHREMPCPIQMHRQYVRNTYQEFAEKGQWMCVSHSPCTSFDDFICRNSDAFRAPKSRKNVHNFCVNYCPRVEQPRGINASKCY